MFATVKAKSGRPSAVMFAAMVFRSVPPFFSMSSSRRLRGWRMREVALKFQIGHNGQEH